MSTTPSSVIGPDLRAALVAMVRKRVPEREVEDIVQSTLADAIISPHAPPDPESFRRWVFGVAKNKVVDYHRRAGRESFEVPEVAGQAAPHTEQDLLRWAERNLPPGEENKTTLDWMLREGEGEKLEWIAETEGQPAPRVRQRVSRLRRHLKAHWQKEVALLAALGVAVAVILWLRRAPGPEPIANEDVARAEEMRKQAFEKCLAGEFKPCVEKLDEAKRLDPAGDTQPAVKQARENAEKGKALTPNNTLPPAPSPTLAPPEDSTPKLAPPVPTGSGFVPAPKMKKAPNLDSTSAPPPPPVTKESTFDQKSNAVSEPKGASKSATPPAAKKPSAKPKPVDTSGDSMSW